MRYVSICAAGLCLLATNAMAEPAASAGVRMQNPIVLAQAEPTKKPETTTEKVKRKVKRAWKDATGYKFAVACPALIPLSHKTCTETGDSRADARAKCQSQNVFCSVSDAK